MAQTSDMYTYKANMYEPSTASRKKMQPNFTQLIKPSTEIFSKITKTESKCQVKGKVYVLP